MNADFEFLTIFAEISLGTTAFFAIVATLRQTLGESLTDYQYLITRFFIDVGMMLVLISIAGIALYAVFENHALAWEVIVWMQTVSTTAYLPYYWTKRSKVITPSSKTALLVAFLSLVSWVNLVLALSGLSELALRTAAMLHFILTYACMLLVFVMFLGSFMRVAGQKIG